MAGGVKKEQRGLDVIATMLYLCVLFMCAAASQSDGTRQTFVVRYKNGDQTIPVTVVLDYQKEVEYVINMNPRTPTKSITLYDFKQRIIAYKDLSNHECFLGRMTNETLAHESNVLHEIRNPVISKAKILTLDSRRPSLTPTQIKNIAGQKMAIFCRKMNTWMLLPANIHAISKRNADPTEHRRRDPRLSRYNNNGYSASGEEQKLHTPDPFLVYKLHSQNTKRVANPASPYSRKAITSKQRRYLKRNPHFRNHSSPNRHDYEPQTRQVPSRFFSEERNGRNRTSSREKLLRNPNTKSRPFYILSNAFSASKSTSSRRNHSFDGPPKSRNVNIRSSTRGKHVGQGRHSNLDYPSFPTNVSNPFLNKTLTNQNIRIGGNRFVDQLQGLIALRDDANPNHSLPLRSESSRSHLEKNVLEWQINEKHSGEGEPLNLNYTQKLFPAPNSEEVLYDDLKHLHFLNSISFINRNAENGTSYNRDAIVFQKLASSVHPTGDNDIQNVNHKPIGFAFETEEANIKRETVPHTTNTNEYQEENSTSWPKIEIVPNHRKHYLDNSSTDSLSNVEPNYKENFYEANNVVYQSYDSTAEPMFVPRTPIPLSNHRADIPSINNRNSIYQGFPDGNNRRLGPLSPNATITVTEGFPQQQIRFENVLRLFKPDEIVIDLEKIPTQTPPENFAGFHHREIGTTVLSQTEDDRSLVRRRNHHVATTKLPHDGSTRRPPLAPPLPSPTSEFPQNGISYHVRNNVAIYPHEMRSLPPGISMHPRHPQAPYADRMPSMHHRNYQQFPHQQRHHRKKNSSTSCCRLTKNPHLLSSCCRNGGACCSGGKRRSLPSRSSCCSSRNNTQRFPHWRQELRTETNDKRSQSTHTVVDMRDRCQKEKMCRTLYESTQQVMVCRMANVKNCS